jgi:EAL domain-containing protein (putative c-di-GMP-specific phosphodiesterase class I)
MSNPTMLTLLSDMLHKLGKVLIAEGVETEQQLEMIK